MEIKSINKFKEYFKSDKHDAIDSIYDMIDIHKTTLFSKDINSIKNGCIDILNSITLYEEEINQKEFKFNIKKIREHIKTTNIKKTFPNFNIEKYLYYLENPLLKVKNYSGQTIIFDEYWVKKNIIAVHQMIFNEMDLYILNIGKEGSGKSCWSSQQILYFHTFFTNIGLIDYAYDITKMYFADILSFLAQHSEQKITDYFRIEVIDEGNELNRGNYHSPEIKEFKYSMRTERKMLRVIMINMQQIGELDTSIALSRVNFIYDCRMDNNLELGLLIKGNIQMYIIPRTNKIYSKKYQYNINKKEIIDTISRKLDNKKDYYVDLPKEFIVHEFKFYNNWGFDKDKYDEYIKNLMKDRKFTDKKINLTLPQAYIFQTRLSKFNDLGSFNRNLKSENQMYGIIQQFFKKLDKYFDSNPKEFIMMQEKYTEDII